FNRVLRKEILLIPLFLAGYLGIVILYYWINTYFPIAWWLAVSASRILASLLPVTSVWIFAGILGNNRNDK
ncbi:MAG TPA: hypothetical protein VLJ10_03775, partial [Candidatus Bathyarchaeia archaeon]|nr:hypothetical protein [Candidatus Bathyarchaeia archaeon]